MSNEILSSFLEESHWLNFELTNACNIPCHYCANKYMKKKGSMTLQSFRSVLKNLAQYMPFSKEAIFCGYGEPFLNKHIYDMIDDVTGLGLRLTIQSNGKWQLDEDRVESLYKVNRLSITIDGATNKVFNLSRPDTNVDSIFENLRKIVTRRARDNKKSPTLTAKMNVFSFNRHEIHDFIRKCTDLGVDQVNLSRGVGPADVMTCISEDELETCAGIELNIDDNLFEKKTNSGHRSSAQIAGDRKSVAKLIRRSPENLFLKLDCLDTATIKWDGTLLPCCWDVNSIIPLGNLLNTTLEEVLSVENLNRVGKDVLKSALFVSTKVPCHSCVRFLDVFGPTLPNRIRKLVPAGFKNLIRRSLR